MAFQSGEGYCVRCRGTRKMKDVHFARYKNNTPIERGYCVECNSKVTKILKKEEALQYELLSEEGDPN